MKRRRGILTHNNNYSPPYFSLECGDSKISILPPNKTPSTLFKVVDIHFGSDVHAPIVPLEMQNAAVIDVLSGSKMF